MDFTPDTGCTDIYSDRNISNTVVAVTRGDCNFSVKAAFILKNGGIGVLNVSPDNKTQVTFEPLPSTQRKKKNPKHFILEPWFPKSGAFQFLR